MELFTWNCPIPRKPNLDDEISSYPQYTYIIRINISLSRKFLQDPQKIRHYVECCGTSNSRLHGMKQITDAVVDVTVSSCSISNSLRTYVPRKFSFPHQSNLGIYNTIKRSDLIFENGLESLSLS